MTLQIVDTAELRRSRAKAAMAVEELLVWAYQRQLVHRVREWDVIARAVGDLSGDWRRFAPDAWRVRLAVEALPRSAAVLVARCALAGVRPECEPSEPLRVVVPDRPKLAYDDASNRKPVLCLVEYRGVGDHEMAALRATYGEWRDALALLRDALQGALDRFDVLPDLPPRAPWMDRR